MGQYKALNIILLVLSLFTIYCAAMNFEWFMSHHKARFFVALFGRNGARVVYVAMGFTFMYIALTRPLGH